MNTTRLHVAGDTVEAVFTFTIEGGVNYTLEGPYWNGALHAQPFFFGLHPRNGVTVTFAPSPVSGATFDAGDWSLTGSVRCGPPDMLPGPHPLSHRGYPINQVRKDDPNTAEDIEELVAAVARHYVSLHP
ncbi:hypothetical protein [Actinomadura miaoliensis]|uniref:Uncharacterized protein n=1 Tax=Actinomadura miaoliensis TaxID=430685 RepID=A0ABP7W8I1_9ACTN